MVTRWSQKSPGLKILWVWTLGTAAILIASVVRTRLQDMDKILKQEDAAMAGSTAIGDAPTPRDEFLKEE